MPISPVAVASMLATARIGILIISIKQDLHESTIHNCWLLKKVKIIQIKKSRKWIFYNIYFKEKNTNVLK